MAKLVTEELILLQKKKESLETKDYRDKFTTEELEIFKKDIELTMGLLLKRQINLNIQNK